MNVPSSIRFLLCLPLIAVATAEPEQSATQELKQSVGEWVETMREIQKEENAWERDRVILNDQRDALRQEISDLEKMLERAREAKQGTEKEVADDVAKRDALMAARERLVEEVEQLENRALTLIPMLPKPVLEEPRNRTLINQIRSDAALTGKEAEAGSTKRLNNVLTLLGKAEEWQQTVHLRDELHTVSNDKEMNFHVMYFGLAAAYAVDEAGTVALVGQPGENGWVFEERPELAPQILEMKKVLTGDTDAKFISLPIQLK